MSSALTVEVSSGEHEYLERLAKENGVSVEHALLICLSREKRRYEEAMIGRISDVSRCLTVSITALQTVRFCMTFATGEDLESLKHKEEGLLSQVSRYEELESYILKLEGCSESNR